MHRQLTWGSTISFSTGVTSLLCITLLETDFKTVRVSTDAVDRRRNTAGSRVSPPSASARDGCGVRAAAARARRARLSPHQWRAVRGARSCPANFARLQPALTQLTGQRSERASANSMRLSAAHPVPHHTTSSKSPRSRMRASLASPKHLHTRTRDLAAPLRCCLCVCCVVLVPTPCRTSTAMRLAVVGSLRDIALHYSTLH